MFALWKKSYDQSRQHIKKQRHYFTNKNPSSQSYGFSSSHVWMWELDCEESWAPKNWCFWSVLEKTLESPLYSKEIQPVHPKRDQSWVFIGRTDVEAETPILWPPDVKNWHIWKDPDAGKDWEQEEKRTTEDEMPGWHHWLNGHGFGWTPGVADGQGGLACCGSWGCKGLDTSERLNWTALGQGFSSLVVLMFWTTFVVGGFHVHHRVSSPFPGLSWLDAAEVLEMSSDVAKCLRGKGWYKILSWRTAGLDGSLLLVCFSVPL